MHSTRAKDSSGVREPQGCSVARSMLANFPGGEMGVVQADENGQYRCPKCGSDDLMREVEGVGVEWGYDWVIEHLVESAGERVDIEELYRDLIG